MALPAFYLESNQAFQIQKRENYFIKKLSNRKISDRETPTIG